MKNALNQVLRTCTDALTTELLKTLVASKGEPPIWGSDFFRVPIRCKNIFDIFSL